MFVDEKEVAHGWNIEIMWVRGKEMRRFKWKRVSSKIILTKVLYSSYVLEFTKS